jgi:hypothetical protein
MVKGCVWLCDYLTTNPNATNENRAMCGIEARKKAEHGFDGLWDYTDF